MSLYEALTNLFKLFETELYEPLKAALEENNLTSDIIETLNKLITYLFNLDTAQSEISAGNLSSIFTILLLITVLILIVNAFINMFNAITNNLKTKKRR